MMPPNLSLRSLGALTLTCVAVGVAACTAEVPTDDTTSGGTSPKGVSGSSPGTSGTGSLAGFTGTSGTSGTPAAGGTSSAAGAGQGGQSAGAGGHAGSLGGGVAGGSGGSPGGGNAHGGIAGSGGGNMGGSGGNTGGGSGNLGGGGGNPGGGSGGSSNGGSGGGGSTIDACSMNTVPTGGTVVNSNNKAGKAAGLDWTIWSNGSGGSITYYDTPAFSAAWNNSGDFLARIGLQWNASKTYDQYGTITAHFNYKKTGTGGGYSYIGVYGWSVSPCVEFYIVDDSYNNMPVNPGSTTKQVVTADTIDGSKYTFYERPTTGTGGSKCSGGTSSWAQFYSIRHQARQCGEISVSEHFKRWAAEGMTLGKMDQVQILIEVGGGTGNIDFTMANVTATTP